MTAGRRPATAWTEIKACPQVSGLSDAADRTGLSIPLRVPTVPAPRPPPSKLGPAIKACRAQASCYRNDPPGNESGNLGWRLWASRVRDVPPLRDTSASVG